MAVQILVIEDDKLLLENILMMLRFEGYEALGAPNGTIGLALARKHLPDLIVSDILMPHLDGYGVLKELRNDPATHMIPLIFLTAKTDRDAQRQGMVLGASDYIIKPFDFEDFLAAIKARLARKHTVHEPFEQQMAALRQSIVFALPMELREPLEAILTRAQRLRQHASALAPTDIYDNARKMMDKAELLERHLENYLLFVQLEILGYAPEYVIVKRGEESSNPAVLVKAVAIKLATTHHRRTDLSVSLESANLNILENSLYKCTEELIYYILSVSPAGTPVQISSRIEANHYVMSITGQGALLAPEIAAVLDAVPLQGQWRFWQAPVLGIIVAKYLLRMNSGELTWYNDLEHFGGWIIRLPLQ